MNLQETNGVRVAIEGCGHGTLNAIYASVTETCNQLGWPGVDLLIIGGDFQSVRNASDLNCVSMPAKYREMGDFHEYYSGVRTAPYLTIFVGGNHEASNYLFELYYGGWVAPNIYYLGAANVLRFGPLRIAGMSGIWKGYNYRKPHFERLPYSENEITSIYHVRELDIRKLLQIRTQVDVGISHDWPKGIEWEGNSKQLFKFKPHLEEDARNGQLGSVAANYVLEHLRPRYWFSAHLHCKYAAIKNFAEADAPQMPLPEVTSIKPSKNEDEIDLDDEDEDEDGGDDQQAAQAARAMLPAAFTKAPPPTQPRPHQTSSIDNTKVNFLALDKCLSGKRFLQLMEVPPTENKELVRPFKLAYDREWLAITRNFAIDEPLIVGDSNVDLPKAHQPADYEEVIDKRRMWVDEHITDDEMVVPEDFEATAPIYDNGNWNLPQYADAFEYPNPQTARFCKLIGVDNPFEASTSDLERRRQEVLAVRPASTSDSWHPNGEQSHGRGHRGQHGRGGGRGRGRGYAGRGERGGAYQGRRGRGRGGGRGGIADR